jgi:glyoxylate reductase
MDKEALDAAGPKLRVVSNMAVGYDNIDIETARQRGIVVTNTPDVLTETTADLAFALLLATARRLPEAERLLRSGQWGHWSPFWCTGLDVYGKTLGIVGMGRIGQAVARRAAGFGMRILYNSRSPKPDVDTRLGCSFCSLDQLLAESDFVVILTALSDETRGLIGRREFSLMKKTAILINVARGAVVDEEALYHALKERRIWAAGLDVYAHEPIPAGHPLLTLDNVVALPHIGSATVETRMNMARLAIRNLLAVLQGTEPPYRVV